MPPPNQPVAGTLALAPGSNPVLGGAVSFIYTVQNQPGGTDLSIELGAKQGSVLVYVAADDAEAVFILGGSASPWTQNGGSATVTAKLRYRKHNISQPYGWVEGAVVTFEAEG